MDTPTTESRPRRLRVLLVVLLSLVTVAVIAQVRAGGPEQVAWLEDLPAGQRAAAASKKTVLIDLTASWCPACQELRRTTWSDRSVASAIAARCVPVKIDVDAHPELGRQYRADYLPTLVLTDPDGHELRRTVGYLSADEFRRWLSGSSQELQGDRM